MQWLIVSLTHKDCYENESDISIGGIIQNSNMETLAVDKEENTTGSSVHSGNNIITVQFEKDDPENPYNWGVVRIFHFWCVMLHQV